MNKNTSMQCLVVNGWTPERVPYTHMYARLFLDFAAPWPVDVLYLE